MQHTQFLCLSGPNSTEFHWVPRALSGVQALSTELFTVHLFSGPRVGLKHGSQSDVYINILVRHVYVWYIYIYVICNMCTYFVSLCFKWQFNKIHHICFFVLWTVSFKTIHLGCKPSFNEIITVDCCTRNDETHKTTCKNTVQCCNPCSANFMSLSRPSLLWCLHIPGMCFSPLTALDKS